MAEIIAYCGIDCAECQAYILTQANDEAGKAKLAAEWAVTYNAPDIVVTCDGCSTVNGRMGGYCSECPVRSCSQGRGLANCGHCAEYPCEVVMPFLEPNPAARGRLDAIHAGL